MDNAIISLDKAAARMYKSRSILAARAWPCCADHGDAPALFLRRSMKL
ncbi:hypothetical protein [Thermovirga sp.]|nr:hypothetical protein [Thermovirga sp.]MBO8154747.1 hypothetical protein [Thermovirga sp.]